MNSGQCSKCGRRILSRYLRHHQGLCYQHQEYIVQEYTSILDGKVRFRIMMKSEYESLMKVREWGMWCHFAGTHYHWDKEQALMEADNLRMERRMQTN